MLLFFSDVLDRCNTISKKMAKFQNGIDLWKIRDKGQLRNYVTYKRNFKLDIKDLKITYDTKKFKTAGPKCISADGVNRGKLYYTLYDIWGGFVQKMNGLNLDKFCQNCHLPTVSTKQPIIWKFSTIQFLHQNTSNSANQ